MKKVRSASLMMLISICSYLMLSMVLGFFKIDSIVLLYFLNSTMIAIPAFLLPAILYMKKNSIRIPKAPPFSQVLICIMISIGFIFANSSFSALTNAILFNVERTSVAASIPEGIDGFLNIATLYLSFAVIHPICEEFLIRGCILDGLGKHGTVYALFISTAFFALFHTAPSNLLVYIASGLIIGGVYVISRNVWLCVFVHAVNNFISVRAMLSTVSASYSEIPLVEETALLYFAYFIILALLAATFLVPAFVLLNYSCKKRGLGRYSLIKADTVVTNIAMSSADRYTSNDYIQTNKEESGSVFLCIGFAILIILNVFSAIVEFGGIG